MELGLSLHNYLEKYRYKYLALYHALRDAILGGVLPGGTRLPATRELARLYGMSRGSAAQSYDMLLAEGYVVAFAGSGTYVAKGIMLTELDQEELDDKTELSIWGQRVMEWALSHDGQSGKKSDQQKDETEFISFIGDRAESAHFPKAEWKSSINYAARHPKNEYNLELPSAGQYELRQAIAGHLRFTRGIQADPEHIVIFSGSMQGIMLISQLLISPDDPVVIENPGYHGIRHAVHSCGGRIVPAQVDSAGVVPEAWDSRLLFVTPNRQYPTGAVLSMERRRELLNWANRHQAIIIEDDYDSEYRFSGRPMEPLKALDDKGRIIYIGSFSKTMFPGLRLGYAVLPKQLIKPVTAAKGMYEPVSPALLEQRALAHFMVRGGYGRHLRRMTRVYKGLHMQLCREMETKLSHLFRMNSGDAGLHVYAEWLHGPVSFNLFKEACYRRGVEFRDAALYYLSTENPAACFTFSHLSHEQIKFGVSQMVLAWGDMQNS